MAALRAGYWIKDRGYFEEIERTCGLKASWLMDTLITNAAYEDGPRSLPDGTEVMFKRGDVFAAGEQLAHRIGASPATVSRLLRRLESAAHIKRRPEQWLKDGLGRAPLIVNVCEYDRFTDSTRYRKGSRERTLEEKERNHQGEELEIRDRGKRSSKTLTARTECDLTPAEADELRDITTGADMLAFYRRHVRHECDDGVALSLAEAAIERYPPEKVGRAAITHRSTVPAPFKAEQFFRFDYFPVLF